MRILLLGVFDKDYGQSSVLRATALGRLGHDVVTFDYRAPAGARLRRWAPRLALGTVMRALDVVLDSSFDVVIVLKGELFDAASIAKIRETVRAPVVNWWPDHPQQLQLTRRLAPAYDVFFTHDTYALEVLRSEGLRSGRYLPFGCEPSVHHPYALSAEEAARYSADITFVGTYSPVRARVLAALEDHDLQVWGPGWAEHRSAGRGGRAALYGEDMFKAFCQAKLALNIHQSFGGPLADYGYGANSRVFEVTGCGGLLLTDRKKDLRPLFAEDAEIICYDSVGELAAQVRSLLADSPLRSAIQAAGHRRAMQEHTLDRRFMVLLEEVGALGSGRGASR